MCSTSGIATAIEGNRAELDVDGNGRSNALTDGPLIIRYLFGLRGTALIDGAVAPDATRSTAAEIEGFLSTLVV